MGKSYAYKPEFDKQVRGNASVPIANETPEGPIYEFKPEYNTQVKKKVGGTESEIGITEPVPTQSELQSKKENATSFLISDINKNDFFSKLAGQTDQYFSHTTPQRVNEQAAQVTQQEVFKNPNSLQRYTDQRIKDINEELANIRREQNKLYENKIVGADVAAKITRSITDQKRYDELAQQAIEKEQYKKQLKNNVAEIAADQILSQSDLSGAIDVGSIGRKISSIADPEQESIFKMAEKGGKTLPGIRREQMNYTGLQAIKSYLSRNTDIPNYDQVVKNVNDLESDFDERNPQTTALRVREKIGAQLYKEGKSSFFGFGYSPSTLKEAADNPETALTNSERKIFNEVVLPTERRLVGTDIPTSGFTRSFYNAIEKGGIGMGKTLGDVTGLRDEQDQAQDVLTQEQAGARYRPAGESPTAQGQLAYLNAKEKTGKLTESELQQKKELENYTYVRNGWSVIKDGMGDLTGQVAMIALATKGLGGIGKTLIASGAEGGLLGGMTRSAIGQALSNETVSLFTTSYLNAYDNYKQQAIQLMPGENQAASRNAYATVMSSVEALSERIFPDTKILTAFTKGLSPTIKDITSKFISREITQQVAREETQKALTVALKGFGKEYLKSTGQESTEEAVVDIAQGIADSVFGGQSFDMVKTGQQALNTFLTTALYSPIVAGMAGRGAMRQQSSQNTFMKSAITDMAANPAQYLQSVEDLQLDGTITQQQANEKIQLIKSANKYLQEIPPSRTVTTKTGEGKGAQQIDQNKPFDYPETSSYLLHRLNEGILTEQIDNTTDEVVKSKLQKDLKRSQEIRKGLFDGTIGVTPDLKEVIDNDEKADELGIFNTQQVQPDELIGTPFEQPVTNVPRFTNSEEGQKETVNEQIIEPSFELTSEKTKEATDFANELITEDIIPAGYKDMAKNSPVEFWQFVAQQAQNVDANWQSLNETDAPLSEQAAIDAFGETIVNYAKELFPISQQKIKIDEEQVSQEAIPTSEEGGSEEIRIPENATEGNESQGDEVLTEQGAEPIAEASLELTEEDIQKPLETTRAKKVSGALRDFATKIQKADITGAGGTAAQSDITKVPREVMAFAINRVADAIDAGEAVVNAIQKGVDYIHEQGHKMEDGSFGSYTRDLIEGKKPRVKVSTAPQKQEENKRDKKNSFKPLNQLKTVEEAKAQRDLELSELQKEIDELIKQFENNREDKSSFRKEGEIISPKQADEILKFLSKKYAIVGVLEPMGGVGPYGIMITIQGNIRKILINSQTTLNKKGQPTSEVTGLVPRRTIFHEYLHPFVQILEKNNKELYDEIYVKAQSENERSNFADIDHYEESKKKEELIVRYLDRLSDNDRSPSLLTRFLNWLSGYFFKKRKNNSATLKSLSKDTTVDQLYDIFKNYGSLNEDLEGGGRIGLLNEIEQKKATIKRWEAFEPDNMTKRVIKRLQDEIKGLEDLLTRLDISPNASIEQRIDELKQKLEERKREYEDIIKRLQDSEKKSESKETEEEKTDSPTNIEDYEMTTSGEVNRFMSGDTWEDVFGEAPEGDQNYLTQKLSAMLQDGKNMIAIAQQRWGGDVMMYGKNLFKLIQSMSDDAQLTNKKAVLLATFLGELQEAKKRSPERFDAINQLEKAVFAYYQRYMNLQGKRTVAGRLVRLYRDKYIGDIYADRILEKEQVKAKKAIQEIEQNVEIDDKIASEETKPITEEEKKKEDKAAKKKTDTAKKEQSKKKKMTNEEAKQRADTKVKEIEEKMGKDGRGGLISRIKEAIKKLNCK